MVDIVALAEKNLLNHYNMHRQCWLCMQQRPFGLPEISGLRNPSREADILQPLQISLSRILQFQPRIERKARKRKEDFRLTEDKGIRIYWKTQNLSRHLPPNLFLKNGTEPHADGSDTPEKIQRMHANRHRSSSPTSENSANRQSILPNYFPLITKDNQNSSIRINHVTSPWAQRASFLSRQRNSHSLSKGIPIPLRCHSDRPHAKFPCPNQFRYSSGIADSLQVQPNNSLYSL